MIHELFWAVRESPQQLVGGLGFLGMERLDRGDVEVSVHHTAVVSPLTTVMHKCHSDVPSNPITILRLISKRKIKLLTILLAYIGEADQSISPTACRRAQKQLHTSSPPVNVCPRDSDGSHQKLVAS